MKKFLFCLSFLLLLGAGISVSYGDSHESVKTEIVNAFEVPAVVDAIVVCENTNAINYVSHVAGDILYSFKAVRAEKIKEPDMSPHNIMCRNFKNDFSKNYLWSKFNKPGLVKLKPLYTYDSRKTFNHYTLHLSSRNC